MPTAGEYLRFMPVLGSLDLKFLRLALKLSKTTAKHECVRDELQKLLVDEPIVEAGRLRLAFALSVLADLLAAGARVRIIDSALYVAWPDWRTESGRQSLTRALQHLRRREERFVGSDTVVAARRVLPNAMRADQLSRVLSEGTFRLVGSDEHHSIDVTYRDVFRAAISWWSMPYRDREGRRSSFVVVAEHKSLPGPLPVGLLEAGDGPPLLPSRDYQLGFSTEAFLSWLSSAGSAADRLEILEQRLRKLWQALKPNDIKDQLTIDSAYPQAARLEAEVVGRSKGTTSLTEAKHTVYLIRLAKALEAVKCLRSYSSFRATDVYTLVRVLRDLSLARLNVELTICGALPPFANALGGKLVAGFAADPRIRELVSKRPVGQILSSVFEPSQVARLLPSYGAVQVTTQGLYPGHSPQYNGVMIPSDSPDRPVSLRKIGEARGATASLMSSQTHAFASRLLRHSDDDGGVSSEFGSGGSKRQRRIEAALAMVGLDDRVVHPLIARPIYGAALVSNLREVSLLNASPAWRINSTSSREDYAKAVAYTWRKRWLQKALDRVENDAMHPGAQELIEPPL